MRVVPFLSAGGQPILTSSKQEDSATEERINAILSDAQAAMQARQNQERVGVSACHMNVQLNLSYLVLY